MKAITPRERCYIILKWLIASVATLLLAVILDDPLKSFYRTKFMPFICDADDFSARAKGSFTEGNRFSKKAKETGNEEYLTQSHTHYREAIKLFNEAFECGSSEAGEIIVFAYCTGSFGIQQDRERGMAILRRELYGGSQFPSSQLINELCPIVDN